MQRPGGLAGRRGSRAARRRDSRADRGSGRVTTTAIRTTFSHEAADARHLRNRRAGAIRRRRRSPGAAGRRPRQGRHRDEPARVLGRRAPLRCSTTAPRCRRCELAGLCDPLRVGGSAPTPGHDSSRSGNLPRLRRARARSAASDGSRCTRRTAPRRFGFLRPDSMPSGPGWRSTGRCPRHRSALPRLEPALSAAHARHGPARHRAVDAASATGACGARRGRRASRRCRVGYADGYPRHVRDAEVLIGGRRVPIVGAVCMDMLMIDVTDVPTARRWADR